jgi:hypothetical protein
LSRWYWLVKEIVQPTEEWAALAAKLQESAADFGPNEAVAAFEKTSGGVYGVRLDTQSAWLEALPVSEIVRAAECDHETGFGDLVQRRAFLGLIERKPVRAIRALRSAAKAHEFSSRLWSALLTSTIPTVWTARGVVVVARTVASLPRPDLSLIVHDTTRWLESHAPVLRASDQTSFDRLWEALLAALPEAASDDWSGGPRRDWLFEAINTPLNGLLGSLLLPDAPLPRIQGEGLTKELTVRFEALLALPGDWGTYALALLSRQLSWISVVAPEWMRQTLVPSHFSGDREIAFWAGSLSALRLPTPDSFVFLKPQLMAFARGGRCPPDLDRILADFLLLGWHGLTAEGVHRTQISDVELREVIIHGGDQVRGNLLWRLGRRVLDDSAAWGSELERFFTKVWPKQRSLRTSTTSAALVRLALALPDYFVSIVEVIKPHLVPIARGSFIEDIALKPDALVEAHPGAMLELLWAVLPDQSRDWPYGANEVITRLGLQPATAQAQKLSDLVRRGHQ